MDYKPAAKLIEKASRIAIFTHTRPDGDAVGSSLGLRLFLQLLGKTVDVFCDSDIPEKFSSLSGADRFQCEIYDFSYDLAIAVDTSNPERLGSLAKSFSKFKNTLSIDHHVSNSRFAAVNIVSDDASCSETVYKFTKHMGAKPDKEFAACILVGIITDSGSFLQSNTRPETFQSAAELAATGVNFAALGQRVFRMMTMNKFNLERRALSNIRFFEDGRISAIYFSLADLEQTGTGLQDTEGIINAALYIEGVDAAIAITETPKSGFKISMRSFGEADMNAACATFGGGGHKNAAGCVLHGPYEEVLEKAVRAVSLELK